MEKDYKEVSNNQSGNTKQTNGETNVKAKRIRKHREVTKFPNKVYKYTDKPNNVYITNKEIEELIKQEKQYINGEGKYEYLSASDIAKNPLFTSRYTEGDPNKVTSWRDVVFPRDMIYGIRVGSMPESERKKHLGTKSKNIGTDTSNTLTDDDYVMFDSSGHMLSYEDLRYIYEHYPNPKVMAIGDENKDIIKDFISHRDPRDIMLDDIDYNVAENGRYKSSYERYMEEHNKKYKKPITISNPENAALYANTPLVNQTGIYDSNSYSDELSLGSGNGNVSGFSLGTKDGTGSGINPTVINGPKIDINPIQIPNTQYSQYPPEDYNVTYQYPEINDTPTSDFNFNPLQQFQTYSTIPTEKMPINLNYRDYDWLDLDDEESKKRYQVGQPNYLLWFLPELFSDLRSKQFQKDPNEDQIKIHYAAEGGQLEQNQEPTLLQRAMMSADPKLYELAGEDTNYEADDLYMEMMKELIEPLGIKHKFTNRNKESDENKHRITIRKFEDGGAMIVDKNGEFVNDQNWSNYKDWKALENLKDYTDYEVVPDTTFTRDKTGAGDIEVFKQEYPEGVTYTNGYHKPHPHPGKDVILYNPKTNDEQDIALDALHLMSRDPTYDTLNELYRGEADIPQNNTNVRYWANKKYEEDLQKYLRDSELYNKGLLKEKPIPPDARDQYLNNEADGLLRNMFIDGDHDYIESKQYNPNKSEELLYNINLLPYINNIGRYLESGQRPEYIELQDGIISRLLPEVYVDENHSWYPNGGKINKFEDGTNDLQIVQNNANDQYMWYPEAFQYDENKLQYKDLNKQYESKYELPGGLNVYSIPGSDIINYVDNNGLWNNINSNDNYYAVKHPLTGMYSLLPSSGQIASNIDWYLNSENSPHVINEEKMKQYEDMLSQIFKNGFKFNDQPKINTASISMLPIDTHIPNKIKQNIRDIYNKEKSTISKTATNLEEKTKDIINKGVETGQNIIDKGISNTDSIVNNLSNDWAHNLTSINKQISKQISDSIVSKLFNTYHYDENNLPYFGPYELNELNNTDINNVINNTDLYNSDDQYDYSVWNNGTPKTGKGCASWVRRKYASVTGGNGYDKGVGGDAWTMPMNIVNNGGEMIYNIYDTDSFNNIKTRKDWQNATESEMAKNPLDLNKLNVGDVVGIYLPTSPAFEKALKNGTTKNTHVGIITGFDEDGMPIVEHDEEGKHLRQRAEELPITVVSRPIDNGVYRKPIEWESTTPTYTLNGVQENDNMYEYMSSAAGFKPIIQKLYPNINPDEIEKIAIAVLGRETNFMNNTNKGNLQEIGRLFKDEEDKSSYLTKFKLKNLSPAERHLIGINNNKDLEDPKKAAAASMLYLSKNYDYFKRLQNKFPIGITDDDIDNLTILSYNQGMNKLKNIGFIPASENRSMLAPWELQEIRNLAQPDAKIMDVTSTNYKYLPFGEDIYNLLEQPYTPYISAAKNVINNKLITNNKNE